MANAPSSDAMARGGGTGAQGGADSTPGGNSGRQDAAPSRPMRQVATASGSETTDDPGIFA
jgi:hypothetical protein